MYMCMCVYVCSYVWVYEYVCVYVYMCVCTRMCVVFICLYMLHLCVCVYMCTSMFLYVCVCVSVYMYVYWLCMCACVCMYICLPNTLSFSEILKPFVTSVLEAIKITPLDMKSTASRNFLLCRVLTEHALHIEDLVSVHVFKNILFFYSKVRHKLLVETEKENIYYP